MVNDVDVKQSTLMNQGSDIEVVSNTQLAPPNTITNRKQDEFDLFGNFVAEVMRNMKKSKSRALQMNIMKLISDTEKDGWNEFNTNEMHFSLGFKFSIV